MKKIKINKYLVLIFLCIGIVEGYTQGSIEPLSINYPDTLVLKTDTSSEVIFSFNRMSRKKEYLTDDLWKSTVNIMETAVNNTELDGVLVVTYRKVEEGGGEVAKVEVSKLERPNDIYVIGGGEVVQKDADRIEFRMQYEQLAISFSVNQLAELEEIKALEIESVWSQIEMKFEEKGNKNLYRGTGKIKYGKADIDEIETTNAKLDDIEITFIGVGLGYYRDRFVPDIGSKISFNMYDRLGNEWMEFGLLYTQQFFFTQSVDEASDFNLDLNSWVSGFWKLKTRNEGEFGVGVGALLRSDGPFYEGSTWKLSIYNKGSNSKITFSPELIFTNDFKDAFPALRFGLSF